MAKIKSTVDLIMEKTKHLSLNDEEKEALEQQQLFQRVQAPLLRYLQEERDANSLARELDNLPPEKRGEAKRICLELLLDRLSPFADNTRILSGVEALRGQTERERWEKTLAPLAEQHQEDLNKARAEAVARSQEALAAAGLKGSAILPKLDDQAPSWKKEREERIKAFRQRVKTALNDL
jgi:hypothetical protein